MGKLERAFRLALGVWAAAGCGATQRPDGGTGILEAGSVVGPLRGIDQHGRTIELSFPTDHLTVVYFYPRDATPGCTTEACAFRDVWSEYSRRGIRVYGVSHDDRESHAEFARAHRLPFSLIADPQLQWAATFGVRCTFGLCSRVTFLLGPDGRVLRTYEDVDAGLHAREILRDAASLEPRISGRAGSAHGDALLGPAPRVGLAAAEASVRLSLQAGRSPEPSNDQDFWLAATVTPPAGAHLSWKHSGTTGLPTRIEFSGPVGFRIHSALYPGPTRFASDAGKVSLGYDASFVVLARVTKRLDAPASGAEPEFWVHGSWLSCDVRCVKEEVRQSITWREDARPLVELPNWLMKVPVPGESAGFDAARVEGGVIHISVPSAWHLMDAFPEQDHDAGAAPAVFEPESGSLRLHIAGETPPAITVRVRSRETQAERFFTIRVVPS